MLRYVFSILLGVSTLPISISADSDLLLASALRLKVVVFCYLLLSGMNEENCIERSNGRNSDWMYLEKLQGRTHKYPAIVAQCTGRFFGVLYGPDLARRRLHGSRSTVE